MKNNKNSGQSINSPFEFAGGSGTLEDPYLIQTADQLNAVRKGPKNHYKLIADIDLSQWGNWVPIGSTDSYIRIGNVVFTDKRIIAVNVQGITGKKKDFTTLPYSKISAYSVETAGTFDLDSELDLYYSGVGRVRFEFKGSSDILEMIPEIIRNTIFIGCDISARYSDYTVCL